MEWYEIAALVVYIAVYAVQVVLMLTFNGFCPMGGYRRKERPVVIATFAAAWPVWFICVLGMAIIFFIKQMCSKNTK
jgi:hypothetical protein